MKEILFSASKYIALASGVVLGFPYISQLKDILSQRYIDKQALRDKKWFTIAILGFTFSAIMNYIQLGNLPIMLAQLFSAIPLIIIHLIAIVKEG